LLFHDWLKDNSKTILFNGAMGTELINKGLKAGKIPDLWNIENPQKVIDVHKSYYDAGSDMCQTNTFGSTPINLKRYNLEDQIEGIIKNAIKNIKTACPKGRLIVADIGPTGEFKAPIGKATNELWYSNFLILANYLKEDVDLWHIETVSDIEEMTNAIKAIKEVSNKPIIASMTYNKTKRGFFTIMGDSLEKCINILEKEKIDVIGANCTITSSEMIELVKTSVELTDKPLSVKPNAGKPIIKGGKTFYEQSPKEFAKDVHEMIKLGVKIVGGCCGTNPKTIKEIRKIIDKI
jgi:5-methyltetrahydrofolate--homocysteine methyltransferase